MLSYGRQPVAKPGQPISRFAASKPKLDPTINDKSIEGSVNISKGGIIDRPGVNCIKPCLPGVEKVLKI